MCGRFALFADIKQIEQHFGLSQSFIMQPRYNIAPTQVVPIIVNINPKVIFSRWSFIPHWASAKEGLAPKGYINARVETLGEKASFKKAAAQQRCIFPMSGYYEWKALQNKKQPFFIKRKDQDLLGIAGIWSVWHVKQPDEQITCAVVTMPASDKLARIHERKPIILKPEYYSDWLNPKSSPETVQKCQRDTVPEDSLQGYTVSTQMNAPSHDSAVCIAPL